MGINKSLKTFSRIFTLQDINKIDKFYHSNNKTASNSSFMYILVVKL